MPSALAAFTRCEVLEGANAYACAACGSLQPASKQICVEAPPNVLVLHLKRFKPGGYGKVTRHVAYPEELSLGGAVAEPPPGGPPAAPPLYRLYALIVHAGWALASGHYYAYARDAGGRWGKLDDSWVAHVPPAEALAQEAYCLFYMRTDGQHEEPQGVKGAEGAEARGAAEGAAAAAAVAAALAAADGGGDDAPASASPSADENAPGAGHGAAGAGAGCGGGPSAAADAAAAAAVAAAAALAARAADAAAASAPFAPAAKRPRRAEALASAVERVTARFRCGPVDDVEAATLDALRTSTAAAAARAAMRALVATGDADAGGGAAPAAPPGAAAAAAPVSAPAAAVAGAAAGAPDAAAVALHRAWASSPAPPAAALLSGAQQAAVRRDIMQRLRAGFNQLE